MPIIRSNTDLLNNYNEISSLCHNYAEPIFITQNGKFDLAVMSIEAYEQLIGKLELYNLIQEGLTDIAKGNTRSFSESMSELRIQRRR